MCHFLGFLCFFLKICYMFLAASNYKEQITKHNFSTVNRFEKKMCANNGNNVCTAKILTYYYLSGVYLLYMFQM